MKKWNLLIDIGKCHDCNNCFLSCKDEHCENDFAPYSLAQPRHGHRWIDILRKERGTYPKVAVSYLPVPCMQCDDADCIKAADDEAIYQREDGIVIIDPMKAKGQRGLVDSCPYGVIWWNEELDLPQKCTFCAHLLDDGWEKPRCVQSCPTGAMQFLSVEDAEMESLVETENLEVWHPEYGLAPRVYYKDLHKFTKCFITGNVVLKDVDECADEATIILKNGMEGIIDQTVTNIFGDFIIDGLGEGSGPYRLEVEYPGYPAQDLQVDLEVSTDVGTIFL